MAILADPLAAPEGRAPERRERQLRDRRGG
jgi:hypothetical protein